MTTRIRLWVGAVPGTSFAGYKVTGCRECKFYDGHLARYIYSNGRSGLRWQCGRCDDYGSFSDIRRSFLEDFGGLLIEDLPVCFDGRGEENPCAICGVPETEWHHWAPKSIFPWETHAEWSHLGAYLCLEHHHQWHDRMREHGLRYPHELVGAPA